MSKTYEMFWDCASCGTEKLLGKTHRHCPSCGAVQDPGRRYFPPEEEKVAVEDHAFVGVDQTCGSCDTPNSAASEHCTNCGAGLDASKTVKTHGQVTEGGQAGRIKKASRPPPRHPADSREAPDSGGGMAGGIAGTGCALGCGALLLIAIVLCALNVFWTSEVAATVTAKSWERSIDVETLKRVRDSDWCRDMPRRAVERARRNKQKSSRRVQDGETCTTVNVDNGDGTFKKQQDCSPRYREEPVMAAWCDYELEAWRVSNTARKTGSATDPPLWPRVTVDGCTTLGCTRKGPKGEAYSLTFTLEGGSTGTCALPQSRWDTMAIGSRWVVEQKLNGSLVCKGITRAE